MAGPEGVSERSLSCTLSSARIDQHGKAGDAVSEFTQGLKCQAAERVPFLFHIAETRTLHLRSGGPESLATYVVHVIEAKCLGKRYPVRSRTNRSAGTECPRTKHPL